MTGLLLNGLLFCSKHRRVEISVMNTLYCALFREENECPESDVHAGFVNCLQNSIKHVSFATKQDLG